MTDLGTAAYSDEYADSDGYANSYEYVASVDSADPVQSATKVPSQRANYADTAAVDPLAESRKSPGATSSATGADAQIIPIHPGLASYPVTAAHSARSKRPLVAEPPTRNLSTAESGSMVSVGFGIVGLAGIGASAIVIYFGSFLLGLVVLAAVIGAIGVMRMTLPERVMASFASRHRLIDSALYLGFALALLVLAVGIPH